MTLIGIEEGVDWNQEHGSYHNGLQEQYLNWATIEQAVGAAVQLVDGVCVCVCELIIIILLQHVRVYYVHIMRVFTCEDYGNVSLIPSPDYECMQHD